MFASKVVKPLTKGSEGSTSRLEQQRSTLAEHQFGHDRVAQALSLQPTPRNRAALGAQARQPPRLGRELDRENTEVSREHRGASRDFSRIPVFPPERASQVQPSFSPPRTRFAGAIQAKLEVGAVDDPLEREADHVAEQVVRMPNAVAVPPSAAMGRGNPGTQHKCSCGGKCEECRGTRAEGEHGKAQRKPFGPQISILGRSSTSPGMTAPPSVHEVLNSPGQPLDLATRAFMEPRFGHDFSSVRLHTDRAASSSAADVGALAYTVGQHIVLRGESPSQLLLAHELTHVVHQVSAPALFVQRAPGGDQGNRGFFDPSRGPLTGAENAKLLAARKSFNLPDTPTSSDTSIVGILITEAGAEYTFHSGAFGGYHAGVRAVDVPRGPGSGATRYNHTHVESWAASLMGKLKLKKAVLLIELEPCSVCGGYRKGNPIVPGVSAQLPKDAQLLVVDGQAATYFRQTPTDPQRPTTGRPNLPKRPPEANRADPTNSADDANAPPVPHPSPASSGSTEPSAVDPEVAPPSNEAGAVAMPPQAPASPPQITGASETSGSIVESTPFYDPHPGSVFDHPTPMAMPPQSPASPPQVTGAPATSGSVVEPTPLFDQFPGSVFNHPTPPAIDPPVAPVSGPKVAGGGTEVSGVNVSPTLGEGGLKGVVGEGDLPLGHGGGAGPKTGTGGKLAGKIAGGFGVSMMALSFILSFFPDYEEKAAVEERFNNEIKSARWQARLKELDAEVARAINDRYYTFSYHIGYHGQQSPKPMAFPNSFKMVALHILSIDLTQTDMSRSGDIEPDKKPDDATPIMGGGFWWPARRRGVSSMRVEGGVTKRAHQQEAVDEWTQQLMAEGHAAQDPSDPASGPLTAALFIMHEQIWRKMLQAMITELEQEGQHEAAKNIRKDFDGYGFILRNIRIRLGGPAFD